MNELTFQILQTKKSKKVKHQVQINNLLQVWFLIERGADLIYDMISGDNTAQKYLPTLNILPVASH